MGEWTLDDVDDILRGEDGRVRGFVQRDDRGPHAWAKDLPLAELALLLRLGRTMLGFPRAYRWSWPRGVFSCRCMPPPFALDVARACGVAVLIGPHDAALRGKLRARCPDLPRMDAIAARACAGVAEALAARLGVAIDLDGLARAERATLRLDPAEDEQAYWSACLGAASFTGEVLRRRVGGRWTMRPLVSRAGLVLRVGADVDANVLDKAMKLVARGPDEESLVQLVNGVEAIASR